MATKKIQIPMFESEFDSSFTSVHSEEVEARDAAHRAGPILEKYLKDVRQFRSMSSSALNFTRMFEFLEWYHLQMITGKPELLEALVEAANEYRANKVPPTLANGIKPAHHDLGQAPDSAKAGPA